MINITVVDAFTDKVFSGNPAAVCILDDFFDNTILQNIASEMNLSETAFLKKINNNRYHIRWFTPNSEAPLCGHATIAATHVLLEKGDIQRNETVVFQTMSGEVEVTVDSNGWINLNFPIYPVVPITLTDELHNIVGKEPVFTGFSENCIFMEFQNRSEIANITPDLKLLADFDCRALIVTAYDNEYDFVSRYFAPRVGINEDPVCASAHCRLIPYWSNKLKKESMIAYQLSQRGGVIKCKNLGNRVLISGKAVTVLNGQINTGESHATQQLFVG